MPTYTYRCDACGHQFDAVQKFADNPLTECPVCGEPIRKVIQPVGVVFKGSGWYITDSRPKPSDGNESKPAAKADGGDGDKAAATPAPAKDSAAPAKEAAPAPAPAAAEKSKAKAAD